MIQYKLVHSGTGYKYYHFIIITSPLSYVPIIVVQFFVTLTVTQDQPFTLHPQNAFLATSILLIRDSDSDFGASTARLKLLELQGTYQGMKLQNTILFAF